MWFFCLSVLQPIFIGHLNIKTLLKLRKIKEFDSNMAVSIMYNTDLMLILQCNRDSELCYSNFKRWRVDIYWFSSCSERSIEIVFKLTHFTSVLCFIKKSIICFVLQKQMTCFYMNRNFGLKWVNPSYQTKLKKRISGGIFQSPM